MFLIIATSTATRRLLNWNGNVLKPRSVNALNASGPMHAIVHFSAGEPCDSKRLVRSGDTPVDLLSFDKSRDFDFRPCILS
jgi:hypothetical protein